MNSKIFWILRLRLNKLQFIKNKVLFAISQRLFNIKSMYSFSTAIIKTLLFQVLYSLIFACILFVGDSILSLLFKNLIIIDSILTDIIIGGMGIAGIILGLYCSNMASIYSSKYANAPDGLSAMFQKDIVTSKCIQQIVGYIVLCLILLLECIANIQLNYFSILLIFILTIRMVITFSITGNRTYQLSNTFRIADNIYPEIYSAFQKVAKHKLFSKDNNFQNHFQRISNSRIKVLEEIAVFSDDNPPSHNSSMVAFMSRNLNLIYAYWNYKCGIYYDSFWFRNKVVYPQWHYASDTEIELALKTGTMIKTSQEKDFWWFEESLEQVNNCCLNKLCKSKDFLSICSYLSYVSDTSENVMHGNALIHWIKHIKSLQQKILSLIIEIDDNTDEDNKIIASIIDNLMCIYLNIVIAISRHLLALDIPNLLETSKQVKFYKDINFSILNFLNDLRAEKMYHCIEAEFLIEKKRITPDWYVEQTISQIILDYFNTTVDALISIYENCFELGNYLLEKKMFLQAIIIFSRFPEFDVKSNSILTYLNSNAEYLLEKHFEKSIIWPESKISLLEDVKEDIALKIPPSLVKCCGTFAIQRWSNRDNYPDLLGFCYNYLCEYLICAIETDSFKNFSAAYSDFLALMLLYQEYIRTDVIKVKELHLQSRVFHVFTAPIIEYAQISGLAIMWGEFSKNLEWKCCVDAELRHFIDTDSIKNTKVLTQLVELATTRNTGFHGIGNRDVLETGWGMRIAQAIRRAGLDQYKYEQFGSKVLDTDSQLLKAFCGSTFDMSGFSNVEDVFFILCVNQYLSKDKHYKGRWGWEDDLSADEE